MLADIGLGLSVIAAAAWSGLLLMLTTVLHPMFGRQSGSGFASDMRRFLPIARRSPTNYVLIALLVLAPVAALVGLWDDIGGAPFLLTALGLVATVAGPLLTSSLYAEPNYDVILSWDPAAVPEDWTAARARWLRLNWIRTALTLVALGLFVAAAYAYFT